LPLLCLCGIGNEPENFKIVGDEIMVKVLIVTHGPLASAMKESAKMFCGDAADGIGTVELFPSDSPETLKEELKKSIQTMDDGSGVLIFVDIFAGTTYNMAAVAIEELKQAHKLECFTGVNMPLLIEVLPNCPVGTLEELKDSVAEIARDTIIDLRSTLDI